ncbi:MAG: hypothetical protein HY929_01100 [Euryarchaeota archaeon]|nr:hypothetical protein [Euryarchaeota archaeon]
MPPNYYDKLIRKFKMQKGFSAIQARPAKFNYDELVRGFRTQKNTRPVSEPVAYWVENEVLYDKRSHPVGTIILNTKECPYACTMCGYWKDSLDFTPSHEALIDQVKFALGKLREIDAIKIYNSGSFFDDEAVPPAVRNEIANLVKDIKLVTVESRWNYISDQAIDFANKLNGALEVAIGLEVADNKKLAQINKKMTCKTFKKTVTFLEGNGIYVKAYMLVKPPFTTEKQAFLLGRQTIDFAFDCGIYTLSILPTAVMDGFIDHLAQTEFFKPPNLWTVYKLVQYALQKRFERVLVDTSDLEQLVKCKNCAEIFKRSFSFMNQRQILLEFDCACKKDWLNLLKQDSIRPFKELVREVIAKKI